MVKKAPAERAEVSEMDCFKGWGKMLGGREEVYKRGGWLGRRCRCPGRDLEREIC